MHRDKVWSPLAERLNVVLTSYSFPFFSLPLIQFSRYLSEFIPLHLVFIIDSSSPTLITRSRCIADSQG